MSLEQLKNEWGIFEQQRLPESAYGKTVAGSKVIILQSDIASAIITTVQTNGQVSTRIKNQLRDSVQKLESIIDQFAESEKSYFTELLRLARLAVKKL